MEDENEMKRIWKSLLCLAVLGLSSLSVPAGEVEAADIYTVIANDVASYNGNAEQVDWITNAICYASAQYQVDPLLITAVMETESHFSFDTFYTTSSAGAIGFMQLMPDTASAIGVNPFDPLDNVLGGASYLRTCLDDFAGYGDYAVTDAVAAYNAGPQAVYNYGGCPPYAETQDYIVKVSDSYNRLLVYYGDGY